MLRTSDEDPKLTVHWFGHHTETNVSKLSKATWQPCWLQPRNDVIYYKGGILHSEHTPYTNDNTGQEILESNIICHDIKLTKDWKMTADSARRCTIAIEQAIQDLPDSADGARFQRL
jgi:hypothetical protein